MKKGRKALGLETEMVTCASIDSFETKPFEKINAARCCFF